MVEIAVDIAKLASYDDSGVTGNKSCYVLEAGEYKFYVGSDVRSAEYACSFEHGEDLVSPAGCAHGDFLALDVLEFRDPRSLHGDEVLGCGVHIH